MRSEQELLSAKIMRGIFIGADVLDRRTGIIDVEHSSCNYRIFWSRICQVIERQGGWSVVDWNKSEVDRVYPR